MLLIAKFIWCLYGVHLHMCQEREREREGADSPMMQIPIQMFVCLCLCKSVCKCVSVCLSACLICLCPVLTCTDSLRWHTWPDIRPTSASLQTHHCIYLCWLHALGKCRCLCVELVAEWVCDSMLAPSVVGTYQDIQSADTCTLALSLAHVSRLQTLYRLNSTAVYAECVGVTPYACMCMSLCRFQ